MHPFGLCASQDYAETNVPRPGRPSRCPTQRANSYDGELGSSITCAHLTVLGSFSNPPLSLIVAYR